MKVVYLVMATATLAAGLAISFLVTRDGQRAQEIAAPGAIAQGPPPIFQLREFNTSLPIYWLGEEYQGLKLVKVQWARDPTSDPPTEFVDVIYASCKPGHPLSGGAIEEYCPQGVSPTFVAILSEWLCLVPPSLLKSPSIAQAGPAAGVPGQVRGAQVKDNGAGDLHFYFDDSTVIISTSEGVDVAMGAFSALRGANPPGRAHAPDSAARLGPPVKEADCADFTIPPAPTETPAPAPTNAPEPTTTPTTTATSAALGS